MHERKPAEKKHPGDCSRWRTLDRLLAVSYFMAIDEAWLAAGGLAWFTTSNATLEEPWRIGFIVATTDDAGNHTLTIGLPDEFSMGPTIDPDSGSE